MDFRDGYDGAPGFLFTTGLHDGAIRRHSVENGWLARNTMQTTPYTETLNRSYSYNSSIEPHPSLKIDLNGNYTRAKSLTEYILYNDTTDQFLLHESPNETGNFNISTFTLLKSFSDGSDPVKSELFEAFLEQRRNIANELGASNAYHPTDNPTGSRGPIEYQTVINTRTTTTSYVDGYSDNQQDVLLGAFYRTYTGRDIRDYSTKNIFPKVPLPNWMVTWDGLGKLEPLKKHFKSVTVRHTYRSTYNISGYSNNLLFLGQTQSARMPVAISSGTTQLEPNFVPYYLINAVTLSERFEPLVKLDFIFQKRGWQASVETRRDKTTSLNLTSFQIIETKGQEYIVGLGYMVPNLKIKKITIQGKSLESDLTIKVDLSFRRNITIIRQITDGISTPTGGTNIITMRSSADYKLHQNVTLRLFYDWIRTIPQTSASFQTSNINAGFSLRITFS
jgi:cell surface protein SprA